MCFFLLGFPLGFAPASFYNWLPLILEHNEIFWQNFLIVLTELFETYWWGFPNKKFKDFDAVQKQQFHQMPFQSLNSSVKIFRKSLPIFLREKFQQFDDFNNEITAKSLAKKDTKVTKNLFSEVSFKVTPEAGTIVF